MAADSQDLADLHALQAGDDRALDRLMARWERPLFAFAWRYLHHEVDARDAAAETFVRLYQQRQRLRPDTNLPAWLFTTTANHCRNRHRWLRRHPTVSFDEPAGNGEGPAIPPAVDAAPGPDGALQQKEAVAALREAVAALPHELRTTVLLHHYERLPLREIGTITGCRERGVETRLYRARQLLRQALQKTLREPAAVP